MPVLGAFQFPPIDELFRWKDIWFNGSPAAINKTVLLILIIGANAFGVWGMLLGVPAYCVARIVVQEYLSVARRQQRETI